ncbi:hypothetical protein L2E82_17461 [Cichorium intybus]|uniref:Uncharacterized protein n=1 Tax=Cichorium intybus TaxID=13427 RepID=A0ACB9F9J6_CICIN|nr:hypothetical protein L2E82_17461 [Cichorium intybus]
MQVPGRGCQWFKWVDHGLTCHYKAEMNQLVSEVEDLRANSEVCRLKERLEAGKKSEATVDAAVERIVVIEESLKEEKKKTATRTMILHFCKVGQQSTMLKR